MSNPNREHGWLGHVPSRQVLAHDFGPIAAISAWILLGLCSENKAHVEQYWQCGD